MSHPSQAVYPAHISRQIEATLRSDTRRDLLSWAHNTVNRKEAGQPVSKDDVHRARHILSIDKGMTRGMARPVLRNSALVRMAVEPARVDRPLPPGRGRTGGHGARALAGSQGRGAQAAQPGQVQRPSAAGEGGRT